MSKKLRKDFKYFSLLLSQNRDDDNREVNVNMVW